MLRFTAKGRIQVWDGELLVSSHVQEREAYERIAGLAPGKYTVTFPVIEVVSSGAFQSVYSTSSESGRVEARGMAVQVVRLLSDTTPPAVPSGFSATASTATTVTLTLTANVESDFSNYVLERSSDNIGWGYLKSFTGTSTTDTVDVDNSVYYYRVFSLDTRGNRSAYTAVKSAGPYTAEFGWLTNVFPATIPKGGSLLLDPYINDPAGQLDDIVSIGAALPSGVTIQSNPWRLAAADTASAATTSGHQLRLVGSAEADWQSRIAGSGVVWYHDFRNAAEVSQFAWTGNYGSGNDPNMVNNGPGQGTNTIRQISDGPTGYCMEVFHPAGIEPSTTWWRPFTPFSSGNGRGVADPGAGVTLRTWSPTNGGNQTASWGYGYYGHPSNGTFDGHDFYIQVRVKMDPRRITGGNQNFSVGKQVWFTLCERSLTSQEHVFYSYGPGGNQGTGKNYLRCYTNSGGNGGSTPLDQYNSDGRIQHGSTEAADFYYSGGWDCILYHVRVGQQGVASGANAMKLEVWAATEAQILAGQGYTLTTKKIWNQEYPMNDFEGSDPSKYALQALILSSYNNGANFPQDFYHRYTQVIFSKSFIPCAAV